MYTYLLGLCDEVRPISRIDKKTGEVASSIDVTITFESRDQHGYLVKSTETINYDFSFKSKFDSFKGKYIAVPYRFLNTRNGAYMFPDETLSFQVFNENPFLKETKASKWQKSGGYALMWVANHSPAHINFYKVYFLNFVEIVLYILKRS